MTDSGDVRPLDPSAFFTYQHPEKYHTKWRSFYDESLTLRESVIKDFKHDLNVKYGPHPFQIMDIFCPQEVSFAPVILYFHGGRWREGHPACYDYFARPWVEAGAIFVSCGYRLEPEVEISDSVTDAVKAVSWWGAHAARYGGDPQKISVAGHSAGGHLAAMVALTSRAETVESSAPLHSAIVMSAPIDLSKLVDESAEAINPAKLVTWSPKNVVVSFGNPEPNRKEDDGYSLTNDGLLLVEALTKAQVPHVTVALGKMDHISTAQAFVDRTSALYRASYRAIIE